MSALEQWRWLEAELNGRELVGMRGVRDPESPCDGFDGRGFDGHGRCDSDGHYLCVECSELSADAPRFTEYGEEGRADAEALLARRRGR